MKGKEFTYRIQKHYGTISTSADGRCATEVNLIRFNDAPAKIDVRTWNKETGQMYRGITLTAEEASNLAQILLGLGENG